MNLTLTTMTFYMIWDIGGWSQSKPISIFLLCLYTVPIRILLTIRHPTTIPEGATKSTIQKEERAAAAKKGDKFVGANETGVEIVTAERKESERLMAIKETGM